MMYGLSPLEQRRDNHVYPPQLLWRDRDPLPALTADSLVFLLCKIRIVKMLFQTAPRKSIAAITNIRRNIQPRAMFFFKFLANVITLAAPLAEESSGMGMMARLTHALYPFAKLSFFAGIKPNAPSSDFSYFDMVYHFL